MTKAIGGLEPGRIARICAVCQHVEKRHKDGGACEGIPGAMTPCQCHRFRMNPGRTAEPASA
ncbi:hypothetical protein C9F11_08990 [Streptomyces sp. YIM 121038]|nr:hypothetical protein C9F11_08990 [Streptomyces sp. YIM 121038]